ncbi:MAG TPA: VOC family protein [Mycobacteriales bacterium]
MDLHDAPPAHPAVHGLAAVAVDCADPSLLAEFYARLFGLPWASDEDGDASVYGDVGPTIDFLQVPEGKAVKNRLHLDIRATDLDAAVEHALTLGATRAPDVYDGDSWVVLRDPEGNEFCLLRPYDGGELQWTPDSTRS